MPGFGQLVLLTGLLCWLMLLITLIVLKWIGMLGLGFVWIMAIAILGALVYALIFNKVFDL